MPLNELCPPQNSHVEALKVFGGVSFGRELGCIRS